MGYKPLFAVLLVALNIYSVEANQPLLIDVMPLGFTPGIDGNLLEWQAVVPYSIAVSPAIDDDNKNKTGKLKVDLWVGINSGNIYVAARWPDDDANTDYRPWEWRGKKYRRSKKRDDMFALRFALSGEYNRSMIADADYEVDVWVWSAGRSNLMGKAIDYKHRISTTMIDNAAEYETDSGITVYIDRDTDQGKRGFKTIKRPRTKTKTRLPSIEVTYDISGSAADVAARGVWKDGFWNLEFQRKLDSGYDDDVRFYSGLSIRGQIAVFNKAGAQHKSVSDTLLFNFVN